jgi:hypothetical protein
MNPAGISGMKKREYLNHTINELASDSKNKNLRDLVNWIKM